MRPRSAAITTATTGVQGSHQRGFTRPPPPLSPGAHGFTIPTGTAASSRAPAAAAARLTKNRLTGSGRSLGGGLRGAALGCRCRRAVGGPPGAGQRTLDAVAVHLLPARRG